MIVITNNNELLDQYNLLSDKFFERIDKFL